MFGVGLGALSYTLALACRNRDWMFWGVQQTLLFPLMILSGMLLPLDDGPDVDAGRRRREPAELWSGPSARCSRATSAPPR